jgi:hypothetical protein
MRRIVTIMAIFSLPLLLLSASAEASSPAAVDRSIRQEKWDGYGNPGFQTVRDRGEEHGEREGHERHGREHEDRDWDHDFAHPDHWPGGYRGEPYGYRRYRNPNRYGDRDYRYLGHWHSWGEWNEYRREHLGQFHDGRYYHEEGHLFFRFCSPDSGVCAFFSIGK